MYKYSFILPIYKVEKYLEECVNSILEQKIKDFEVILVDDGSPDDCPKMCDKLQKMDNRIKVIHKKHDGVCDARNAGLKIARGQYILFVDPDDYVAEDYLERIDENVSDCDMLVFGYYNLYKNKFTNGYSKKDTIDNFEAERYILQDNMIRGYVWNKVFKKEIIQKYNLMFDVTIAMNEDVLFCFQYLENSKKIKMIDNRIIYYRQRKSSLISQKIKHINASDLVKTYKYIISNSSDNEILLKSKSLYLKNYYKYKKYIKTNDFDKELIESILANDFSEISKNDKCLIFMYKYCPFVRGVLYTLKDLIMKKYE